MNISVGDIMLNLMEYILLFATFCIILLAFRNFIDAILPNEKKTKNIKIGIFNLNITYNLNKKVYFDCILWANFGLLIFSLSLGIILVKYSIDTKILTIPMFLISAISLYVISVTFILKNHYHKN